MSVKIYWKFTDHHCHSLQYAFDAKDDPSSVTIRIVLENFTQVNTTESTVMKYTSNEKRMQIGTAVRSAVPDLYSIHTYKCMIEADTVMIYREKLHL
jgi:hypothetical protein